MAARKQKTAAESTEKSGESSKKRSSSARSNDVTPRAHPDAGLTKTQVKKLHQKLVEERDRINARIRQRVGHATEDASPLAEEGDIAQRATEQDYQLRLADKQHKLLDQVLAAISKMENGEYGVCEGSEEPIGYRRLEIRPWARYSVEYKERMDRRNR
ncbi:MAG: TraR/DksA family transcriptional regulator [Myxococcota bacterium]